MIVHESPRPDQDGHAPLTKLPGDLEADAAISAGDERDLAIRALCFRAGPGRGWSGSGAVSTRR